MWLCRGVDSDICILIHTERHGQIDMPLQHFGQGPLRASGDSVSSVGYGVCSSHSCS